MNGVSAADGFNGHVSLRCVPLRSSMRSAKSSVAVLAAVYLSHQASSATAVYKPPQGLNRRLITAKLSEDRGAGRNTCSENPTKRKEIPRPR